MNGSDALVGGFDGLHFFLIAMSVFALLLSGHLGVRLYKLIKQLNAQPIQSTGAVPHEVVPPELAAGVELDQSSNNDSAVQLLALLQKEARLVDFLQQELDEFSDEEVGATARVVHQGARKVLVDCFSIESIRPEEEETSLSIDKGFDRQQIRLVGQVTGEGPFQGVLLHRGWQTSKVELPKRTSGFDASVIAPAEVEV